MNAEESKKVTPTKRDLFKFGLTLAIGFAVLGALSLWGKKSFYYYFFVLSLFFLVPSLAAPTLLKPIHRAWMTLAGILGWFMTRAILTVLFYVAFTSIGVLGRLLGKRFLDVGTDDSKESYWIPTKQSEGNLKRYEEQY